MNHATLGAVVQELLKNISTVAKKQTAHLVARPTMAYSKSMKQLKQLSERLAKIENLALFCRVHNLKYRSVQRLRANEGNPTLALITAVSKALDKEDKSK